MSTHDAGRADENRVPETLFDSASRTNDRAWSRREHLESPGPSVVEPKVDSTEAKAPASAPLLWLLVAAVCVLMSCLVFFVADGARAGVLGWAFGGPLAIGSLAVFTVADIKRRQSGWYRPSVLAVVLRRAVICLSLAGVVLNAYKIANDVARGVWT